MTASAPDVIGTRTKPLPTEGDERRTERCTCERSRLLRLLYACGFTASAAGRERHYVRIPLESFEIEGLIRLKVLPKAHREDADALQAAVLTLVYQALDGAG